MNNLSKFIENRCKGLVSYNVTITYSHSVSVLPGKIPVEDFIEKIKDKNKIYNILSFEHLNKKGQLHNENGYAIEYKDGTGLYFINGERLFEDEFKLYKRKKIINKIIK